MVGRRQMTRTAAGDKENVGGLQTAMVDDVRRRRTTTTAEADDGDDGQQTTKRTEAADDVK